MSDRKFGLQLGAVMMVVVLWGLFRNWSGLVTGVIAATALALLTVAAIAPSHLAKLHRGWMLFSHWLGRFISPVVLTIIYGLIIIPSAMIMRLFRRDVLDLSADRRDVAWNVRDVNHFQPNFFLRQW